MKPSSWKDMAELIGIASIVASLIFVGMQMRQDQVLARSELGSQSFGELISLRMALMEDEFYEIWARALEAPETLTTGEMLTVNGYLEAMKLMIMRDCYLQMTGVFEECEVIVREHTTAFFGNRYAQLWWRNSYVPNTTFLPPWVDTIIRGLDEEASLRELEALRSQVLREQATP